MASRIEVSVDLGGLEAMLSDAAMEKAQDDMSRRWRDLMEPYVPMEYGPLREHVEVEGQEITYTEGYAACVYNMDEGANFTTAGTGPHWNEAAKAESIGELEEYVGRVIAGGAK